MHGHCPCSCSSQARHLKEEREEKKYTEKDLSRSWHLQAAQCRKNTCSWHLRIFSGAVLLEHPVHTVADIIQLTGDEGSRVSKVLLLVRMATNKCKDIANKTEVGGYWNIEMAAHTPGQSAP